jgi:hypothetical protein
MAGAPPSAAALAPALASTARRVNEESLIVIIISSRGIYRCFDLRIKTSFDFWRDIVTRRFQTFATQNRS